MLTAVLLIATTKPNSTAVPRDQSNSGAISSISGHAEADLQGGRAERGLVDAAEGAQRQMHADDEEQHQDAEFGQQVDGVAVGDQADPGRPEHGAGNDVADQRRLAQAGQEQPAGNRADEQQRDRDQVEVLDHQRDISVRH